MIKGVNKTIIEINEFDSQMFEKAILFIKPSAKNYTKAGLKSEAKKYLKELEENPINWGLTRQKRRKKVIRNRIILGIILGSIVSAVVCVISILI